MQWWHWILISIPAVYLIVGGLFAAWVYWMNEGALSIAGAIKAVWQWPVWLLVAARFALSVGGLSVKDAKASRIRAAVREIGDRLQ